jgi:RHS repeat-associated protein
MTESFTYGPTTALETYTDFNGQVTTFSYDNNGRLQEKFYTDGTQESYSYDAVGNRLQVTTPQGTTHYQYDNRHRLVKETRPDMTVLEYSYDNAGNRSQFKLTPPTGEAIEVQYHYDSLGRLQSVTAPDGSQTVYNYNAGGNLVQVSYPNGTQTLYSHDSLNRLTQVHHQRADLSTIAGYQYTLAPTGHRTQVLDHNGRIVNYSYDALYRLTQEKITLPAGTETVFSYEYDSVGNRLVSVTNGVETQYSYDANDRLIQQDNIEYQYDANGNTLSRQEGQELVRYRYDAENRLIEASTEDNGQISSTVSYGYDSNGNRMQRTQNGQMVRYVVDSNQALPQVVAELDENGEVKVNYLYGNDLISQDRDEGRFYYHSDGLGSTRVLTDSSGASTDSYDYEAFGSLLSQAGATPNDYLFTGEQYDPYLGQYYLRARYYDPAMGRFTSLDSFDGFEQEPVTLHKYLYGNGDPVNNIDPSGEFSISHVMAGVLIGAGVLYFGFDFVAFALPSRDSRTEVYLDFDRMRTPGFDKMVVQEVSVSRLRNNYNAYGINFNIGRGNFFDRIITYAGNHSDYYGFGFWIRGFVFTDGVLGRYENQWMTIDLQNNTSRAVNANEIGTAIGNLASHELGHMYGAQHVYTEDTLHIMRDGTKRPENILREVEINGQRANARIDSYILPWHWSPQTASHLNRVFD